MLKMIESPDSKIVRDQTIILIDSNVTKIANQDGFNLNQEINRETITAYLKWKFPQREHSQNNTWVTLLLSDLNYAGVQSYNQIEKVVNDNLNWFDSFEKANQPSDSISHRFSDVGALRIILTEKFYP